MIIPGFTHAISQAAAEGPPGGVNVPLRGMVWAPSGKIRSFLIPETVGLEMLASTTARIYTLPLNENRFLVNQNALPRRAARFPRRPAEILQSLWKARGAAIRT